MVQLTLHIWMDYNSDLECHLSMIICFVRTSFTLRALVSLVKVFTLFRLE
jgi:hypothetical protein